MTKNLGSIIGNAPGNIYHPWWGQGRQLAAKLPPIASLSSPNP